MFCDSLLDDADWLKRYATNAQATSYPTNLIRDTCSVARGDA